MTQVFEYPDMVKTHIVEYLPGLLPKKFIDLQEYGPARF